MGVAPQALNRIHELRDSIGDRDRARRVILLAAVLALASADSGIIGAEALAIRRSFSLSNAELGLLASISTAVGAIVTVPAGSLVDRYNRVRLLSVSIGTWGLAMVASAAAPSYPLLAACRVGLGIVSAVGYPAVASLLGDFFAPEERSRIYGLVLTGELIGAGFGFIVAGLLAEVTWRLSFGVMVVPSLILAFLFARLHEPERSADRMSGTTASDGESSAPGSAEEGTPLTRMPLSRAIIYVLSVPTNVVLIVSGACSYFFFAGVKTFGIEFATHHYGVSHGEATMLLLLIGIGAVAGVVAGGRLGDRLESPRRPAGRILVAVVAMELTAIIFVPAILTSTILLAVPLLAMAAGAWGAVGPPLDAARLSVMPPRLWGRAEGIRSVLRQGAEAMAPTVFGVVADSFGRGGGGLESAFLVMLIPLGLAGGVMATGLRTYPRDAARHGSAPRSG